jgi:hypothetical protein
MKKTLTLLLAAIILTITSLSNAQDSLSYKIKYEKFRGWKRTGQVLTISGLVLGIAGTGLIIYGTGPKSVNQDWPLITGSVCAAVGTVAIVPGAVYWGIGKSKSREYKLKLENLRTGFYYKPNSVYAPGSSGLVLTFRF